MVVHGREVTFFRSVWAECEILNWADGDIAKIEQLFESDFITSQNTSAKFIAILSEASEQAKEYEDPNYVKRPLTIGEALTLSSSDFSKLFNEAMAAWTGAKPTIEAVPVKKTRKTAVEKTK